MNSGLRKKKLSCVKLIWVVKYWTLRAIVNWLTRKCSKSPLQIVWSKKTVGKNSNNSLWCIKIKMSRKICFFCNLQWMPLLRVSWPNFAWEKNMNVTFKIGKSTSSSKYCHGWLVLQMIQTKWSSTFLASFQTKPFPIKNRLKIKETKVYSQKQSMASSVGAKHVISQPQLFRNIDPIM